MSYRSALLSMMLWSVVPVPALAQSLQFEVMEAAPEGSYQYPGTNTYEQNFSYINSPSLMFLDGRYEVAYRASTVSQYCTTGGSCSSNSSIGIKFRARSLSGAELAVQTVDTKGFGPTSSYPEPGFKNIYYRRKGSVIVGGPQVNQLWQAWKSTDASDSSGWALVHVDGGKTAPGANIDGVSDAMRAVPFGGTGHIFYVSEAYRNLRHVWWDLATNAWRYEVLDGDGGAAGRVDANFSGADDAISVVVDGGQMHIFYIDEAQGDLRRAFFNGASWSFETVAGATRRLSPPLSALMFGGNLQVFVSDADSEDLLHISKSSLSWSEYVLDGAGTHHGSTSDSWATTESVARLVMSAVIVNGKMHVFYDGAGGRYLRHAEVNGSAISFGVLQDYGTLNPPAKLTGVAAGMDGNGILHVVATTTYSGLTSSWVNYVTTRLYHGQNCQTGVPCPF